MRGALAVSVLLASFPPVVRSVDLGGSDRASHAMASAGVLGLAVAAPGVAAGESSLAPARSSSIRDASRFDAARATVNGRRIARQADHRPCLFRSKRPLPRSAGDGDPSH